MRITPTPDTLERLRERDRQIEALRKQVRELAEARRLAAIKLELELAAAASSTGEEGDSATMESSTGQTTELPSSASNGKAEAAVPFAKKEEPISETASMKKDESSKGMEGGEPSVVDSVVSERVKYDVILTAERSWISASLKLYPGEYFVFADVSYAVPYEEAFKMTMPAHLSEAPWLDAKHPANHVNNIQKDSMKSFTRRSSSAIVTNVSPAKSKLVIPSGLASNDGTGAANSASSLGTVEAPDLSKLPQIWFQASSLEFFEVKAITRTDLPLGFNASVADIEVPSEKWPFSSETQADVSSRALQNMLTKAKTDAQLAGLQFMSLANQYKEERKKMLQEAAAAEAAAVAQR